MSLESSRRVVITGLGLVSPLGSSKEALWDALVSGQSGVQKFESIPSENLTTQVSAECRQFSSNIEDFGDLDKDVKKAIKKALKVMCRESQLGVAAAQLAQADAGLPPGTSDPDRSGVVFGSDYMLTVPQEFAEGILKCGGGEGRFEFPRWGTEGLSQMTPLWLLKYLPNMPASHIAIYNDLRGPNNSITHREAASNLAVGEAFHTILRGSADRMVAGATGTRVHPMKAVHAAQTEQLASHPGEPHQASRPFDLDRTGMVLGEGSGAVVLEELSVALARGATIYAEVVGAASSSVADRNLVGRRDKALINAMRGALRDAGLSPADVGHLHAHGLSTLQSDAEEAKAINEMFGPRAADLPVVAAKSNFGNLGAGSGVVELIASVLALKHGHLFPMLNYETPDPECPVRAVTSADIPAGSSFLNLNVTPQGQAAVVMIKAFRQ